MRALFIFDGGLAPGYTAVAVGLTEEGEKLGWECWAARSGFRSLCQGFSDEPQLVRVVSNPLHAYELNQRGFPTESMGRRIFFPGSDFRSERFPQFADPANQQLAATEIVARGFEAVICCGGDGTLHGARALSQVLPKHIKIGFINISADSDICNDRSVGFLSCAEHGAEVVRGLYEDGYTHQRIYFLEMMGNRSGRHALHAGAAARAHLIILPQFNFADDVLEQIASKLSSRRHAIVVVAEGYKKDERASLNLNLNAAEFLAKQLEPFGLVNSPDKRVICEGFSRSLRGLRPLLIDCEIAHLKCQMMIKALHRGESNIMAFYRGESDLGLMQLSHAYTDNSIDSEYIGLIDRLNIGKFRDYVLQKCNDGMCTIK